MGLRFSATRETASKQIWEKVRCHGLHRISHPIAGEHTFQGDSGKGFVFHAVQLGQGRVGFDFGDFFFHGGGIVIVNENHVRLPRQNLFIADGDPLLIRQVIKDIFPAGQRNQQGFKIAARAGGIDLGTWMSGLCNTGRLY